MLERWQQELVDELLREVNGRQVYREALVGVPRKNGKSTLASALALWFLVVEGAQREGGAEVYSAAAAKDQARIVFSQAKEMVENSPRLSESCRVFRDAITVRETGAVYRVLSSDAPKQHGLNRSAVVVDELHAHRDDGELYYALRTAGWRARTRC